jgi:histidine triad (HIT) family protein
MMECLFCKIASGEIGAETMHENERLIVIRDLNPQAPTHLLVIPKTHSSTLMELEDTALMAEMIETAKGMAVKEGIAESGFRIVINTNAEGGQTVFHLHMHILGGRPLKGGMG